MQQVLCLLIFIDAVMPGLGQSITWLRYDVSPLSLRYAHREGSVAEDRAARVMHH